jgi:tRNA(Ile)-lysidine synthase
METVARVADYIARTGILAPGGRVVVGVSGGTDSLCLLDCLHRLGYSLVLAHLDHRIRPESGEEAESCLRAAQTYAIPAEIGVEDVRAFAEGGYSLEEAGRLLRYRFLARTAKKHGCHVIATGHTADDQAETILMHFLRGSGPDGLRGMLPSARLDDWVGIPEGAGVTLVRPLLGLQREQTLAHCLENGLEPIQDPSNEDQAFFRNRLRQSLLPELETYNPGIRDVLLRTGQVMAAIAEHQEEEVDDAWPEVVEHVGERALRLRMAFLRELPQAIQRALMRRAIWSLKPLLRDVGFEQVARALHFLHGRDSGRRQALVGDLELLRMGEDVLLWAPGSEVSFSDWPQLHSRKQVMLEVPGKVDLAMGWQIVASRTTVSPDGLKGLVEKAGKSRVFLDGELLKGKLHVRGIKAGDRIRPLGMKGRMKVADLYVNEGIPQPVREKWPLVMHRRQIVWVAGLRMAEAARLTEESRKVVELRLVGVEGEAR